MCEKCWASAYFRHMSNPQKSQAEHYRDLLDEWKGQPFHAWCETCATDDCGCLEAEKEPK